MADDKPLRVLLVDEITLSISRTTEEKNEKYKKEGKEPHNLTVWANVGGTKKEYFCTELATLGGLLRRIKEDFNLL